MQAEITRRKGDCKRRNQFFETYDRLYYLQHYGKRSPGSIEGTIKGKKGTIAQVNDATVQVETMRSLINVKELRIKVFPRWISGPELEAGSEVERWLWGVISANDDRLESLKVRDILLFDALRLGWAAAYTYWDGQIARDSQMLFPPEMMQQSQGQGQERGTDQGVPVITECPIIIEKISPYFVYPELGGRHGRWRSHLIIEPKKRAQEVYEEWGVKPKALRKAKPDSKHLVTVEYTVYWGWEYLEDPETGESHWWVVNCVMADNEIIRPPTIMENYDALPITIFFCVPTGDPRWEYMSLSALFPIHLHIKLLDHLLSRLHKQVDQATNMPLAQRVGRSGKATPIQLDKNLYNVVQLQPEENLEYVKWPGNAPDFHALVGTEQQKIQEGGFSSLAVGAAIPISGIAASRLWESQYIKLVTPTKMHEAGLKTVLRKVKSLAAKYAPQTPISVLSNYPKASGNVMLMGMDLEPYTLDAELAGELPMDSFRKKALGMQICQLPPEQRPLSLRTIVEDYFDIDQPEEEHYKKLIEMAEMSKTVQLLETYNYLLGQGMDIDIMTVAQLEGVTGSQPGQGQGQQQGPMREAVSTAMSPYEPGVSTMMEDQFGGEPPGEAPPGFLRGAAAIPGGFGGGR